MPLKFMSSMNNNSLALCSKLWSSLMKKQFNKEIANYRLLKKILDEQLHEIMLNFAILTASCGV